MHNTDVFDTIIKDSNKGLNFKAKAKARASVSKAKDLVSMWYKTRNIISQSTSRAEVFEWSK